MIRIIFIGKIKISLELIKTIYLNDKNIIKGVITNKSKKSDFADLSNFAKSKNIPFFLTKDINDKRTYKWIKQKKPDIIFCVGWSRIIKRKVLSLPKKYSIGFHPTKLPHNRGKHPIIWPIILDLKKSASTFFLMNERIDDGKIISQKNFTIGKNEYVKNIYEKIIKNSKLQIIDILDSIKKNKINNKIIKKNVNKFNYWRKRSYLDGKIDFRMGCRSIFNLVRALSKPYPGAHFEHKNKEYKVFKIFYKKTNKYRNIENGKVLSSSNNIKIKCEDGYVLINKTFPKIKLKLGEYI